MIYAGNFKTNHTRASTASYILALNNAIEGKEKDRVVIFPPISALDSFDISFTIGVQNAYPTQKGAFTGEIGVEQLDEFGIKTILIGHSERREILKETQDKVIEKFNFFKSLGFEIFYCIGEPLSVREMGEGKVKEYLLSQFDGIDIAYDKLIVAYEPIWAIGTGRSASVEDIRSIHQFLKLHIDKPLLYGGSVNPSNIREIGSIDGVDGVLVGSASLKVESFLELMGSRDE